MEPKARAMVCGRSHWDPRVMLETAWLSAFEKETVMTFHRTHHKMVCPLFVIWQTVLTWRQSALFFRETNILIKSSVNFVSSNISVIQNTIYQAIQYELTNVVPTLPQRWVISGPCYFFPLALPCALQDLNAPSRD